MRNVITNYRLNKHIVKTNRAIHPESAVLRCVDHMQQNDYGANIAEVYSDDTGEVFAQVVRRTGQRRIEIIYRGANGLGVNI